MNNIVPADPTEGLEHWDNDNDLDFEASQHSLTMIAGGCEMLRVANDGFYVRGVKVTQDDKEAEIVYNAFKQFLTWAEMNRR
jgi:hypothetical protein